MVSLFIPQNSCTHFNTFAVQTQKGQVEVGYQCTMQAGLPGWQSRLHSVVTRGDQLVV